MLNISIEDTELRQLPAADEAIEVDLMQPHYGCTTIAVNVWKDVAVTSLKR